MSERIKLTAGPGRRSTEHERSVTLALAGHPRLAGAQRLNSAPWHKEWQRGGKGRCRPAPGGPQPSLGGREGKPPPEPGKEAWGGTAGTAQDRLSALLPDPCPLPGGTHACTLHGDRGALPGKGVGGSHPAAGEPGPVSPSPCAAVPRSTPAPPRQPALCRCPLQAGLWPGFVLPAETGRRLQETLGPRPGSDTVLQPRSLRWEPE